VPLDRAFRVAAGWVRDGVVPGVAIAVAHNGDLAGEWYGGKLSAGSGSPVAADTLFSIDTITRVFTATALLRLVEQGRLGLDEPVRRFVPALATPDKREITARHLLSHTAGFPANDPAEETLWSEAASFERFVESAARLPLEAGPGERVVPSQPGYWVAAALATAIAGVPFAELVQAEVLQPFGFHNSFVHLPADAAGRAARRYGHGRIFNTDYGRRLGSPAAGMFASARDLVRFASIFVRGGLTPEGERVLSAATVSAMTSGQTAGLPVNDGTYAAFCLGWGIKGETLAHVTGDFVSARAFFEVGRSGCLLLGDPGTGVSLAVLANRDLATGWTSEVSRWGRLVNAIVAAVSAEVAQ
jgi:CubicO group peptidase (beta-lactamase class C family)